MDPNTDQNNNDIYTDIYDGKDTLILYDLDQEQHVVIKEE